MIYHYLPHQFSDTRCKIKQLQFYDFFYHILVAGKACMATDALAALATKESFDKVKLRKAETVAGGSYLSGGDRFVPYKDLMLIQVKGE